MKGAPHFSSYVETDADGRITDLSVHPTATDKQLESLEVYVISKQLLIDLVDYCASHDQFSFSRHLLLPRLKTLKVMSYIHEGYAGRFQSVADYFQRSMEMLDPAVCADLFNDERPIRTKDMSNPSSYYGPESKVVRSLVSDGCCIEGEVENCVISRGVTVEKGAKVSNSILMQGTTVKAGAALNFVITDKDVVVNEDRSLMGHFNYPLAIAKNSIV
jgi:glucose-1-phosphate adenylyltransferase